MPEQFDRIFQSLVKEQRRSTDQRRRNGACTCTKSARICQSHRLFEPNRRRQSPHPSSFIRAVSDESKHAAALHVLHSRNYVAPSGLFVFFKKTELVGFN